MYKLTTTVKYRVSTHGYCNLKIVKDKGFPASNRCRFCTNLGKKGFVCVLHNERLAVEDGFLIKKTDACTLNMAHGHREVQEPDTGYKINLKGAVNWHLNKYAEVFKKLVKDGWGYDYADQAAKENLYKTEDNEDAHDIPWNL